MGGSFPLVLVSPENTKSYTIVLPLLKQNWWGFSAAGILKAASWSSTSTFCCFYHRPIDSGQSGRGVLQKQ